eukprot:9500755-Pyramimonas_sp.AAC.1
MTSCVSLARSDGADGSSSSSFSSSSFSSSSSSSLLELILFPLFPHRVPPPPLPSSSPSLACGGLPCPTGGPPFLPPRRGGCSGPHARIAVRPPNLVKGSGRA